MLLRKWAIFFGGLFLLGSIGIYISRGLFQATDRIKSLIQSEASNTFAGKLDFDIKVGFGKISLEDIELTINDGRDSIYIKELPLDWSLYELLRGRLKPPSSITSIAINNPVLTIGPTLEENVIGTDSISLFVRRDEILEKIEKSYNKLISNLNNVSRITISDGKIQYKRKNGSFLDIASEINGKMLAGEENQAMMYLSAQLFKSEEENLFLDVNMQLESFRFEADLILQDFALTDVIFDNYSENVRLKDGRLNSQIQIIKVANPQGKNDYFINGHYEIDRLAYDLKFGETVISVTGGQLEGKIRQNSISVETFVQKIADGTISTSGKIDNIFNPELDFVSRAFNFDLESLQADGIVKTSEKLEGILAGTFNISGPLVSPDIQGVINSDTLIYSDNVFSGISADVKLEFPFINFDNLIASYQETNININTRLNLLNPDSLSIEGSIEGDLLSIQTFFKPSGKNSYRGIAEFNLLRTPENLQGGGTILLSSRNENGTVEIESDFTINDHLISIKGNSVSQSLDSLFWFTGEFNDHLPEYNVNIENAVPVLKHEFDLHFDKFFNVGTTLNMEFYGDEQGDYLFVNAVDDYSDSLFVLTGAYLENSYGEKQLNCKLTFPISADRKLNITGELSRNDNHYYVNNLNSPSLFNGDLEIIENGAFYLDGNLNIATDIEKINELSGSSFLESGEVSGNAVIKGTTDNPEIKVDVNLINGVKNRLDNITGNISLTAIEWGKIIADKIIFTYNDTALLKGAGNIDLNNKYTQLDFSDNDVPLYLYDKLLLEDMELLQGNVSYNVHYIKNDSLVALTGEIKVPSGKLERFSFIDLELTLRKEAEVHPEEPIVGFKPGDIIPNGIWISSLKAKTPRGLDIDGSGFISISDDYESDMDLYITGDLLTVLMETDPYFQFSSSSGNAHINLAGRLQELAVSHGTVDVKDGILHLETIFDKVENLNFSAKLDKGTRYIEILNLEAELDGKWAKVKSYESVVVKGDEGDISLQPMNLMEDGLNLGIIVFETGQSGVNIELPDFFEDGETGKIILTGKYENEEFYFAGPADNPYVRGNVLLSDSRIIYPVLEEGPVTEPGIVLNFLDRIVWDCRVIPVENNLYIQENPVSDIKLFADIWGDMLLKCWINDDEEGLYFSGSTFEDDDYEFKINGDLKSTKGDIEVLDFRFRVEEFEAEFNDDNIYPVIKGKAKDTKINPLDPNGSLIDIYFTIYSYDKFGNKVYSGTWIKEDNDEPNFTIELYPGQTITNFTLASTGEGRNRMISGNADQYTTETLLGIFGYAPENIEGKFKELAFERAEDLVINPFLNPINRRIERILNLDEFRIRTNFAKSLAKDHRLDPRMPILTDGVNNHLSFSSLFAMPEFSMGKYLVSDVYVSYTGQVVQNTAAAMGLSHIISIEYLMKNQIKVEFQYNYDFYKFLDRRDTKIWIGHNIVLKGLKKKE